MPRGQSSIEVGQAPQCSFSGDVHHDQPSRTIIYSWRCHPCAVPPLFDPFTDPIPQQNIAVWFLRDWAVWGTEGNSVTLQDEHRFSQCATSVVKRNYHLKVTLLFHSGMNSFTPIARHINLIPCFSWSDRNSSYMYECTGQPQHGYTWHIWKVFISKRKICLGWEWVEREYKQKNNLNFFFFSFYRPWDLQKIHEPSTEEWWKCFLNLWISFEYPSC